MTHEALNREPSPEAPKVPELTTAAESFLDNPLTDEVVRDDGATERTLSTEKVDNAGVDPIELTSVAIADKTAYTMTRWDGLRITSYTWSNDPSVPIITATPDRTGLLVSRPANTTRILSDLTQGLDRFKAAVNSSTAKKSYVKSVLENLGRRRAA